MTYNYPPYNPYNQMQPYQNQMMMQPQQITQPQMQTVQQPAQPAQGLSNVSRPVTNREEAIAVPADFTGAPMVFPDITHNMVYIKRWNMQTGNADFVEYAPVIRTNQETKAEQPSAVFASLEDFRGLQDIVSDLQKEIERLKKPAGKAVKKNDPSDE